LVQNGPHANYQVKADDARKTNVKRSPFGERYLFEQDKTYSMRMAPILLVGGILLIIIGLYWAVTASTYICFGGLACQSSYNAWMLERTLGSSSLFIGIGLLAVGTYMWFKVRPSIMEKGEQLPSSTDSI